MATTRLSVLPAFIILGLTLMSTTAAQPAAPDGFLVPTGEPFLRKLDLTRPELAPVKQALDRGDVPAAEAAFIAYFRHKPLSSPLLTNWDARTRDPAYRNGAAQSILAGHIDDGYSVYDVPSTGIDWVGCPLSCLTRFPFFGSFRWSYHHTRDPKYARFMVDLLLQYIKAYPIEEFVGKKTQQGWVRHTTVAKPWYWCMIPERLMEIPETLSLVRQDPAISDQELLTILHRLYQEAGYLTTEIKHWVDLRHNGGCAMVSALAATSTLLSDFTEAQRWLDYDAELALQYLTNSFYPDGMCVELTCAYSAGVSRSNQEMAYALREREVMAKNKGRVASLITCIAGLSDPTGSLPSFGDLYAGTLWHGIDMEAAGWAGLDWVKTLRTGGEGPLPPFTVWPQPGQEQWCGYYTMRSGWDKQARYLAIDAGPWGTTHQHGDRLSFVVTALGQKFIIDPSSTRYAANTPDSFISRQVSGFLHNTITIDGVDEFRGDIPLESKEPLHNTWEHGDSYSLFAGSYSFAPLKPVKWERRVVFADRAYWLLQDVLTGEQPEAQIEQNFQFEAGIEITFEGNKTIADAPNGARLVLVPMDHELKPTLTIGDKVPHTTYWPDGKPKLVQCREDNRDQQHGRGWTGRGGDKLIPAPAVTYTGPVKLPGTLTVLMVPLEKGQGLEDLPKVTSQAAEGKVLWALPVKGKALQVECSAGSIVVR